MSDTTTYTVRVGRPLSEFIAEQVGADGLYENVSEYLRDLIRKDKAQADEAAFQALKAELTLAFAQSDEDSVPLEAVKARILGKVKT